jgi:hypothetical protein
MKKIILSLSLLLLLSCSAFYAQDVKFKSLDSLSFVRSCDKLINQTGKNFKKINTGKFGWEIFDKYTSDENESLFIVYFTANEGENKDLEIKGNKRWFITSIASKYLTVFELYKFYFNSKADKIKIQSDGSDWSSPESAKLRKTSQEGLWEVKIW